MNAREWPPHLYRGPQSTAHPYPLEIAYRAQIFTVGAIFFYAFADVAVGEYVRIVDKPDERIRDKFLKKGLSIEDWETNWRSFEAYLNTFPNPVFQNALFGMITHWDWYIGKLGKFLEFARTYVDSPTITKKMQANLKRISFTPIGEQISILKNVTGLSFGLKPDTLSNLIEMNLVRNLGMHNQWAVDEYYLKYSQSKSRKLGSLREVTPNDLEHWQQAIISTILNTSTEIAKMYVNAPDFSSP